MLTGSPLLVLIVAGVLAFLAIVQFWLATRHDHAVSIQGPLEEERAIFARIAEKRATLTDIELDLQKRREALAVVSDIQSEVDSLTRKRDQLLDEWAQSEERRNEVQTIRREIEEAQIDKLRLDAELAAAKAEHDEVRDRLARAERLLDQVDAMKEEHSELTAKIEELRPELRRLEEAQERVDRLAEQARILEADMARLEGATASRQGQLAEMEEAARSGRAAVAGIQEDLTRAQAQLAAADVERKALDAQISRLKDTRAALEARIAVLEDKIKVTAGGAAGEDPLRELKTEPQVVSVLRSWKEAGVMEENDALHRVQLHFQATGLTYPERTLRAFHTAMKVNESTQMAVLAGISGTGKSQLPRQYAAGMGIGFLQVPVQPRWDSPQDLMGFYNYVEGRFRPTDMARALWALDEVNNPEGALRDRMLMILLDEMNLARVEYYFSDFLSRLESRPAGAEVGDRARRKDAEIELEIPTPDGKVPRIFPGYNLLFAGTMNEDESTQSLSDKVVDRANVIRFAAPKQIVRSTTKGQRPPTEALRRSVWERWSKAKRTDEERETTQAKIEQMVGLMRDLGRPFGHRLGRAMLAYVDRYPVTEGVPNVVNHALADQVEMRLLPKLRGVEVEAKSQELARLQSFVAVLGDDPLADAIGQSVEAAAATGQFVWQGVTR
ncbi:chromosome segregation ATPase-like protein [Frigidibacter albus]|uniref:Chromosome segregation ATPase-like protein n=1 Tax=Frigidibacter albus TaxID=1465486 RepID=A0A6L8VQ11_9RHOB|nr:chromosome segregation ATPase-like protein [Frigidibacter albus]MZQ91250.1 chromosome segregation ATPase-like protein [Frigidibacter albus]NBE33183.1 chromosome segregation ATPase-like protein [Frigidibacter albus]GGH63633.1 hypothetical protein GCM10011341_38880 [Frigidibacter albus]